MDRTEVSREEGHVTGLLDLPRELRDMIYDHAYNAKLAAWYLAHHNSLWFDFRPGLNIDPRPRLHQVNKQLRHECMRYHLKRDTFIFDLAVLDPGTGLPTVVSWAKDLGVKELRRVKDLIIQFRPSRNSLPLFSIFFWGKTMIYGIQLSYSEALPTPRDPKIVGGIESTRGQVGEQVYLRTMVDLNDWVKCLNESLVTNNRSLKPYDLYGLAEFERRLRFLQSAPRWLRDTWQLTGSQNLVLASYVEVRATFISARSNATPGTRARVFRMIDDRVDAVISNVSRRFRYIKGRLKGFKAVA